MNFPLIKVKIIILLITAHQISPLYSAQSYSWFDFLNFGNYDQQNKGLLDLGYLDYYEASTLGCS